MTRCLALKNPCAIRLGSAWKGSVKSHDKEFCEFSDVVYGIRAFFVLMRTYHYKYKLSRLTSVMLRYAPLNENNTYGYVSFILKYFNKYIGKSGISDIDSLLDSHVNSDMFVNTWINSKTPSYWLRLLCKAIARMESDYVVSDKEIDEAIKLL